MIEPKGLSSREGHRFLKGKTIELSPEGLSRAGPAAALPQGLETREGPDPYKVGLYGTLCNDPLGPKEAGQGHENDGDPWRTTGASGHLP